MNAVSSWDLVIFVAAVYFAVTSLTRLMHRQRNAVVAELQEQVETERRRQSAEKKKTEQVRKTNSRAA